MFTHTVKTSMTPLVVVTFLVVMMTGPALAEMNNEAFKASVEEIFEVYASANMAGDADLWSSLWDEDGVKMVPNKPAILGKATIKEGKRKGYQKADIESQVIRVEDVQVAGEWGFARGTYSSVKKPKAGGEATTVSGQFTTIFKKQADESWKIYWDSVTVDTAPK